MKKRLLWLMAISGALLAGALWYYTGQLLYPSWRAKDLSVCDERTTLYWGKDCGNLRVSGEYKFEEMKIRSLNGTDLHGWRIPAPGLATQAAFLVHGGGSDRREMVRYIHLFQKRGADVYLFDLSCHGESPCAVPGLTFGHRESRDIQSIYAHILNNKNYQRVYAMATSVGATSVLTALPVMQKLTAVIAENPMYSFQRFVFETPAAPSFLPVWFKTMVVQITCRRGRFDGAASPGNSLSMPSNVPVFFLHSKNDDLIPWQHSVDLNALYTGPKTLWLSDKGRHAAIWNADKPDYEARITKFLDNPAVQ